MAFRPRRSSFVDHQDVSSLQLVEQLAESGAPEAGIDPETVSAITRGLVTVNPAAAISATWLSVVCSAVETRQYANSS